LKFPFRRGRAFIGTLRLFRGRGGKIRRDFHIGAFFLKKMTYLIK